MLAKIVTDQRILFSACLVSCLSCRDKEYSLRNEKTGFSPSCEPVIWNKAFWVTMTLTTQSRIAIYVKIS